MQKEYQPGDLAILDKLDFIGDTKFPVSSLTVGKEYKICYSDEIDAVTIIYLSGRIGIGFDSRYFTIRERESPRL